MKRTPLLFLIESLSGGGAEKVLTTLLKNLDSTKFDVTLCCVVDAGKYVEEVKPYVYYRYILRNPEGLKGLAVLWYRVKYALVYRWLPLSLVYKWFVPQAADVEIAFVEGFVTKLLSHSTNRKARKIAWVHIDLHNFHWTRKVYHSVQEESEAYQKHNQIISVSETVKQAFLNEFPRVSTPIQTLYNPIDSKIIVKQSREELSLSVSDSIRLVSVGRLTKQKAFDRLLHIAGKLKNQGYSIELWLLGEGELRRDLERIISDEGIGDIVTLWGFQSNPYKYMSRCDLFVCSSISEGYSTAVTEALILGLPVITTDCSGMAELLKDGECGLITENSETALYRGIKEVLDNPERLAYYRAKALSRGTDFTISQLMQPIENLFSRC